MTVRSSMTDIIAQVRLMANDPNGEFTDQQIQDVLDQRAYIASYEEMTVIETLEAGAYVYKEFQSDKTFFETDTILTDTAWNTLTPDTADFRIGYFTFNTSQNLPVLIYGWWYDVNAAAADMWDLKAARYADAFDFTADGGSYSLSQKVNNAQTQAQQYRAKSATASAMGYIERTDVAE